MAGRLIASGPASRPAHSRTLWWRTSWAWAHVAVAALTTATLTVVVATAWAYVQGALGYVDNGDGYYLYAAHRMAQGAVLYRDVMGTQPPLAYALGAVVFKLGGALPALRLVSAAMRALSTALVFAVGWRLFTDRLVAALGALIFTLLPIGLAWDRSFDVNPLLTLVALLAVWPLLRFTPRAACLSGALAALALFTKNLYLPLLATTLLYLAVRRRHLLAPYLCGLTAGLATLAVALAVYAGPAGLHDAFLGQQSSPFNADWLVAALAYVVSLEGGIVLVAIAGAVLCRRDLTLPPMAPPTAWEPSPSGSCGNRRASAPLHRRGEGEPASPLSRRQGEGSGVRAAPPLAQVGACCTRPLGVRGAPGFAPWWLAGASVVLLATLKEGTAGPVFQVAEPVVALLAAYGAVWALRWLHDGTTSRQRRPGSGAIALALPIVLGLSLVTLSGVDGATLRRGNAAEAIRVAALVRAHARPGTAIVAPPYYALLTGTRIPGDAADTYILAQRIRRGDPWAMRWLRRVDADLARRRIPIVLIDLRLAAIAPLMSTLRARYHPLAVDDTLPPALHVVAWLPAGSSAGMLR